jgi:hypothetical protein
MLLLLWRVAPPLEEEEFVYPIPLFRLQRDSARGTRGPGPAATLPHLARVLYVDLKTSLPDDMLVKVDRASMAHALEPLLDALVLDRWAARWAAAPATASDDATPLPAAASFRER